MNESHFNPKAEQIDPPEGIPILAAAVQALSGDEQKSWESRTRQEFTVDEIARNSSFAIVGDVIIPEPTGSHISVKFSPPGKQFVQPAWLIQLNDVIEKLGQLTRDYDGEGSIPAQPQNIEAAKILVRDLFEDREIQCKGAYPTSGGGIELEIEEKFWEASIVVESPESVEFVVKNGSNTTSGQASPEEIPQRIWDALG